MPDPVRHPPSGEPTTYITFLRTPPDLQTLAPATREPIFAAITDAIAEEGGRFEIAYEAHLYVAGKG